MDGWMVSTVAPPQEGPEFDLQFGPGVFLRLVCIFSLYWVFSEYSVFHPKGVPGRPPKDRPQQRSRGTLSSPWMRKLLILPLKLRPAYRGSSFQSLVSKISSFFFFCSWFIPHDHIGEGWNANGTIQTAPRIKMAAECLQLSTRLLWEAPFIVTGITREIVMITQWALLNILYLETKTASGSKRTPADLFFFLWESPNILRWHRHWQGFKS